MLTFARHTNEWNLASASNQRYDNIHWCSLVTNEKLKFSNSQILKFSPEQSKNFWIINRRFMDTLTFVTNSFRIIFRKKHHFFRNLTLGDLKEPWIKKKPFRRIKEEKFIITTYNIAKVLFVPNDNNNKNKNKNNGNDNDERRIHGPLFSFTWVLSSILFVLLHLK